ncbi:unnamed protein product [Lepeophtheirus salmonis]|uniref:(salmon louse) hypothetical protein n=1 Tax=Lepeophtheirus salmonis TaxID=72036 RepID=A0A7R8CXZ7_LEPSM|nr:unnamed protein product [Lepeophtheirus salmonis]CAF2937316.1 unnamed protein product [Lepeophtheirus salmonis]
MQSVGNDIHNLDIASMHKGKTMKGLVLALSFVKDCVKVSDQDIIRIEKNARLQALSRAWKAEQKWRYTASRFGDIFSFKRLFEIINEIEVCGIQIFDIIFDLGNKTFHSQLGLLKLGQFSDPHDPRRPIFGFLDVSHLIRLTQNDLLDKGYLIPNCNGKSLRGGFGLYLEEQLAILDEMLDSMNSMQIDDLPLPLSTVDDCNFNEQKEPVEQHKKKAKLPW